MSSSKRISSSEDIELKVFDQKHYTNTFYCCDNNHPFIAFTACYCPICAVDSELAEVVKEVATLESDIEQLKSDFYELYARVNNVNPELLI